MRSQMRAQFSWLRAFMPGSIVIPILRDLLR